MPSWIMSAPCFAENHPSGTAPEEDRRLASLRLPLVRLLQLVMILQCRRFPNAQRLAELCAVSRRTIYRDLALLEAAGITVVYHSDRQGYELVGQVFLQPAPLDEQEALALLVQSRLYPADEPFGLLSLARTGLDKVLQSLPDQVRRRLLLGAELIAGDPTPWNLPADRRVVYEAIWSASRQQRQMRLWYREDAPGSVLTTKVSLYRLARIGGCWSVVGRSTLHREVRLFRIPWIQRVDVTDEPYHIPPRFRLERWLARTSGERACQVQLRFTPQAAPMILDAQARIGQIVSRSANGELDLHLEVPLADEMIRWILGFGDQVEVLEPASLRRAVRDKAEQIARIHANPTHEDRAGADGDAGGRPGGATGRADDGSPVEGGVS
jgi:proteasome accessory factor B